MSATASELLDAGVPFVEATVGSPAAYVNAIVDALAHAGVRNLEMPVTSDKVWQALNEVGLAE